MGVCQSASPAAKEAQSRSKMLEKGLKSDERIIIQKLLLLGAGESGKSTILKQMIILHKNGFSTHEREERKNIIYGNIITDITAIIMAMGTLKIAYENSNLQSDAQMLLALVDADKTMEPMSPEVVDAVNKLWQDLGVQQCYARRAEYQLNDSAKYFIESIERISKPDFVPNDNDMLQTRVATSGVVEVTFTTQNISFRVFDVGGQRSERRKWIHCFDDVHVIIFVAAISEYDQTLREDENANRLVETLDLFKEIVNNKYFIKTNVILFMNKRDLFEEKIARIPLTDVFSNYTGGINYGAAVEFLRDQFQSRVADVEKQVFMHETCATDTNQVQQIITGVIDTIIANNIRKAGF